jgi:NhaA family Na+:H+ antiporter
MKNIKVNMPNPLRLIRRFIHMEASSGIILLLMTVFALILSNSAWAVYYDRLINTPISFSYGLHTYGKSFGFWINDGLMTLFFLLVGLEIKRELCEGELNTTAKRLLPGIAALGGMIVPALIYAAINHDNPTALRGWAIPTATDIAFTLGLLSLLGSRVPFSLKIFLTALAIIDDLGAIVIIALFYSHDLSFEFLALSVAVTLILILMNRLNVHRIFPYVIVGTALVICVMKSGIHSTIAGVIIACTIPLYTRKKSLGAGLKNAQHSPLRYLEHRLHPWVAFGILPLFAFANAGVHFSVSSLLNGAVTVPLGIICGLVLGKPIGVTAACWLAIKCRWAVLPDQANWRLLWGTACMCGIGFTMSLFIGALAFSGIDGDLTTKLRAGVLIGSTIAGMLGYLSLHFWTTKKSIRCQSGLR